MLILHYVVFTGSDGDYISVLNGITYLKGKINNEDIVIVYYDASPFTNEEIISDGIKVVKEKENPASATPCFLLMGSNDDGIKSTKWVDRE